MDYIAKRDIPALGIRQGKVFFDEDDPIFQDPTLFDEYIPEVYILTTDTPVSIAGYFKELGDRRCVLNGRPKNTVVKINEPMLGTVKKIEVVTTGVRAHYDIHILGNNGLYYLAQSPTLDIRKLENEVIWAGSNGIRKFIISPSKVYWFINSNGEVQSDIRNRNKKREAYLHSVGLYFESYKGARDVHDAIMAGKMRVCMVEP